MGQHNRQIYRDHKCNFKIVANIFMIMLMYFNNINQPLLRMANKKYMTSKTNRVYNGIAHVSTVKTFPIRTLVNYGPSLYL